SVVELLFYAVARLIITKKMNKLVSPPTVKICEKYYGRTFEPGYNPNAVCIRHTL
ncbi:unnamed protein product, partial [Choristocarpus tenellus]